MASAFGDNDHGVIFAAKALFKLFQESIFAMQIKGYLGHEAKVNIAVGQRGGRGDPSGLATHQANETHAITAGFGFGMSTRDNVPSGFHRGFEPERTLDQADVVIDGFGDSDDRDRKVAFLDPGNNIAGSAQRAVATDGEENVDAVVFEGIDNFLGILRATRGLKNRAPLLVNLIGVVSSKLDGVVVILCHKAFIAILESKHAFNAIAFQRAEGEGTDHIVQSGAEPSTSHDAHCNVFGVEEKFLARAG